MGGLLRAQCGLYNHMRVKIQKLAPRRETEGGGTNETEWIWFDGQSGGPLRSPVLLLAVKCRIARLYSGCFRKERKRPLVWGCEG